MISLITSSKHDMKKYLEYELAPFSLSLFAENGLRKNVKSHFYDEFTSIANLQQYCTRVDGGLFLLYKRIWKKAERSRRKISANIPTFDFQRHTKIPCTPKKFLSNKKIRKKKIFF